ncbi:docking protein 2-like [Ruditapes philippinarum]|uniref:docking protein 2-like n=1 Tax=Ruditapes philippinarum TaxID=129788 RepID=UPI00295C2DF6|nr:docking protein 2-like [Ruditapes philippinarum]
MMEGHEKYDSVEVGSTEVDSNINVVDMTKTTSGGNQHDKFQVIIEPSQLTKMCAMEGEMTLSIKDKALYFKDKNTGITKYWFPFSWIRRFGKDDSVFSFEVGRKCPNGEGHVICITKKAKQIHKKCIKGLKEKKASMK